MKKLTSEELSRFVTSSPDWKADGDVLHRAYKFDGYANGVAFAVKVAMAAEKRDHHPDILIGWGRVEVRWSTHDVGGVSDLDTEMAARTDAIHRGQ